jgi:glycerate dehydrogenase
MLKIVVLDGYCLNPGDLSWDGWQKLGEITVFDRTPSDQTVDRAGDAEAVIINKMVMSKAFLAALPRLRYIGVLATGYNVVDIAAATEQGITVTNVPTYGTDSVAEHVFALILELARHPGLHANLVRNGEWARCPDFCFWRTPLIELSGKTMGVIGFGRIGRKVGEIAQAVGMKVLAQDKVQGPPLKGQFEWTTVDRVLAESDVVSLHCPLFPDTERLINKGSLAKMKPTAFLVNTSRGPLIADQDLADALNSGKLAGAAVDVLSVEPPVSGNPLLTARNCLVTPHIAWATKEARSRLMQIAIDNLAAFQAGKPQNVVNKPK